MAEGEKSASRAVCSADGKRTSGAGRQVVPLGALEVPSLPGWGSPQTQREEHDGAKQLGQLPDKISRIFAFNQILICSGEPSFG